MNQYTTLMTIKETDHKRVLLLEDPSSHQLYIQKELQYYDPMLYETIQSLHLKHIPELVSMSFNEEGWLITLWQYINAPLLSEWLEDHAFDFEESAKIILQLMDTLEPLHLHSPSIIYRDLKPDNIFYDGKNIMLFDFDISRLYDDEQSRDTVLMGTEGYAAPEQYGFSQSDARTDIYGLGVLFHELLTGKKPNEITYRGVGASFIETMIAIDPDDRYQSIKEARSQLQRLVHTKNTSISYGKKLDLTPPGFRSKKASNAIIAIFGYILIFFASFGEFEGETRFSTEWFFLAFNVLGFCLIPLFIMTDYLGCRRICLFQKNSYQTLRTFGLLLSAVLYFLLYMLILAMIDILIFGG